MDIYIRNIDPGIKIKLKENAKKKGISLNEYVKNILETAALSIEVTSLDDKYSNLTKELLSIYTGIIEKNTSVIAENNYILFLVPILGYVYMTIILKNTEEKWLYTLYGEKYKEYCDKVNRCIPIIKIGKGRN